MSVKEIGAAIGANPHVESFHDLHVWEVCPASRRSPLDVLVPPDDDCHGNSP